VPSVHRIPPTDHSTKPEEFRLLIDMLYPTGKRLELFARRTAPGWDAWGTGLKSTIIS
jgi:N6-adenosine-specific RNA methylase IME4